MTGSLRTLGVILRTTLVMLLALPAVLAALVAATASSINRMYPDDASRLVYEKLMEHSTVTEIFQGRGYDLSSQGGIMAQQMAILTLTLFPLVAAWFGVRLTRSLEDRGFFEIITSGTVGRLAPVTSGILAAFSPAVLTGLASWWGLVLLDYEVVGSGRYALLISVAMIAATALGTLSAQLFRNSHEALYLAMSIVLGLFLLRGWIDVKGYSAVWTNPASWLAEARPFAEEPVWWPYLAYVGATVVLVLATLWFAAGRDLGGGVFNPSAGRREAGPLLSTPLALLIRLTYKSSLVFALGGGLMALVFGTFAEEMAGAGGLDARLVLLVQLNALFATAAAVMSATTLNAEECAGRSGRVLSEPVSRYHWLTAGSVVALLWGALVMAFTAAMSGVGLWLSLGEAKHFTSAVADTFAYYPTVALCAAATILIGSLVPRLSAVVWLVVGWAAIVTLRADVLQLSELARHLSPLEWLGKVPLESWAWRSALGMSGIALAGLVVALFIFRRRDIVAG